MKGTLRAVTAFLMLTNLIGTVSAIAGYQPGTVVAWGNNQYGQANPPPDLTNVVAIAAGELFGLALRADGTVAAWGRSDGTNVPSGLNGVIVYMI